MNEPTKQPTPEDRRPERFRELVAQFLPFAMLGFGTFEPSDRRAALATLLRFIAGPDTGERRDD